jgi:hypothetical protein
VTVDKRITAAVSMRKLALLFFLSTGIHITLFSQPEMVRAYVVTDQGDTLRGEARVNPKKEIDNYYKITFRDASGMQKVYKPNKIRAYGFNDENYVAMDSQEGRNFYKVLTAGEITLYKLGYETMRMNTPVFEAEYFIARNGEKDLMMIRESKFRKQISEWMKDKPEFAGAYGDPKKFDPEKAAEAIKQYNTWKASQ